MTDHIRKTQAPPVPPDQSQSSKDLGQSMANLSARYQSKDNSSWQSTSGEKEEGDGFSLSQETFSLEQSLNRARREQGGQMGEGEEQEGENAKHSQEDEVRILVTGERLDPSLGALTSSVPELEGISNREKLMTFVEELAARIDRTVRLELGLSSGGALSLKLAFEDTAQGVTGVVIKVTPTHLDIVLERSTLDATPAFLAATRELSQRLQKRFATREIRIADRLTSQTSVHRQAITGSSLFWDEDLKGEEG